MQVEFFHIIGTIKKPKIRLGFQFSAFSCKSFCFLENLILMHEKKCVHPKLSNSMARLVQCITYIVCIYLVHYKGNFSGDLHNNANPDKNTPIKVCVRVIVQ